MANYQRIKDLADEKKLGIRELAFKIGCTDAGLYKMLKNEKMMVDTLEKIADTLGVNISEFFADFIPARSR